MAKLRDKQEMKIVEVQHITILQRIKPMVLSGKFARLFPAHQCPMIAPGKDANRGTRGKLASLQRRLQIVERAPGTNSDRSA